MTKNVSIQWHHICRKSLIIQNKITQNQQNFRNCRNFQRFFRKTSFIQLFIIKQILYQNTHIDFDLNKDCFFFKQKIDHQLWFCALSPLFPSFRNQKAGQLYRKLCQFCHHPTTRFILVNQFSNFFNKKTKKWLLSTVCMEKKYFFQQLLPTVPHHPFLKRMMKNGILNQWTVASRPSICLRNQHVLNNQKNMSLTGREAALAYHPTFQHNFVEYNEFLLISLQTDQNLCSLNHCLAVFKQKFGLHLSYCQLFSLKKGLNFSGWFFRKNVTHFSGRISRQNVFYHQKQIRRYLKNPRLKTQSMDHIILELNRKIVSWQKFYNCSQQFCQTCSLLNNFLFKQIWLWIKKRHRNQSSQWLYKRYWTSSTNHQWIFSVNNETLIFYRKIVG